MPVVAGRLVPTTKIFQIIRLLSFTVSSDLDGSRIHFYLQNFKIFNEISTKKMERGFYFRALILRRVFLWPVRFAKKSFMHTCTSHNLAEKAGWEWPIRQKYLFEFRSNFETQRTNFERKLQWKNRRNFLFHFQQNIEELSPFNWIKVGWFFSALRIADICEQGLLTSLKGDTMRRRSQDLTCQSLQLILPSYLKLCVGSFEKVFQTLSFS